MFCAGMSSIYPHQRVIEWFVKFNLLSLLIYYKVLLIELMKLSNIFHDSGKYAKNFFGGFRVSLFFSRFLD